MATKRVLGHPSLPTKLPPIITSSARTIPCDGFPGGRFGHSVTRINESRVIVFGGCTGGQGEYTVKCDTLAYDILLHQWFELRPDGECPTPRVNHAAACVSDKYAQLVIHGGTIGGGKPAGEDLMLLDFEEPTEPIWVRVPVRGPTPGQRFGHTMVYSKRHLVLFGGCNGKFALADAWAIDVTQGASGAEPATWSHISICNELRPSPRSYATAAVCRTGASEGMIVVFGGRDKDRNALNDTWGLVKHKDGRWEWIEAPASGSSRPKPRFQHACEFIGSHLVLVGGRGSDQDRAGDQEQPEPLPVEAYDMDTCKWQVCATAANRNFHGCWVEHGTVCVHGGFADFDYEAPTAKVEERIELELDLEGNLVAAASI